MVEKNDDDADRLGTELGWRWWRMMRQSKTFCNTTAPTTCLPHTGFAGVWTPATRAEFLCDRTIHMHGSRRASGETHTAPQLAPLRRRLAEKNDADADR